MTDTKGAAKLIRKDLKAKFPQSKFSVRMGGQAIYVCCDKSANRKEGMDLVSKY